MRSKSNLARRLQKDRLEQDQDHEEAYCLIDTYPEIAGSQRKALKDFIEGMEEELEAEKAMALKEMERKKEER